MPDPIDSSFNEKIVSFNIYAAPALGGHVKNGRVEGIVSYQRVPQITGSDPAQLHSIVAPELPQGSPESYKDYNYAIIRMPTGTLRAIGMPWIDGEVTVDHEVTFLVTIRNTDLSKEDEIRRLLLAGNFTDFAITVDTEE